MKSNNKLMLELKVTDMILEVARLAESGDITNSDLQGIAQVKAIKIIDILMASIYF